jgi:uncharacterized metal-binding protein YceD (DUF177 family)
MNEAFKIYVDQLRDGHMEELDENLPPGFLDIHEKDLTFQDTVKVKGEAYLANDELVLHLDIEAKGEIPCTICNEKVIVKIDIPNFYYAVPLAEVKSGIYNFSDILRETILLEVTPFAECEGNCPKRKEIQKYLKKDLGPEKKEEEEGYKPFADLDLE